MSTYITLIRFTQKGMEAIKEGPAPAGCGETSVSGPGRQD